jgi:hypothetical protein
MFLMPPLYGGAATPRNNAAKHLKKRKAFFNERIV